MWTAPVAAVLASACVGNIGNEPEEAPPPQGTPTDFACDPTLVPETLPLRRLSQRQYRNTVVDLAAFAVPGERAAIRGELETTLDRIIDDQPIGEDKHYARLSRLDQSVQQNNVDVAYDVGAALGTAITTPPRLGTAVGPCATDGDPSNDDACLRDFILRFGERALRRPVTDEDLVFYSEPAGQSPHDPADYADVVTVLVNAPEFLYFVESGQPGEDDTAPLGAYELASRLSFHFWQTMPDEGLFAAARSGALLTEEGYARELDRVYADPRTRDALAEFFGQWLINSTLDSFQARVGVPAYDALLDGLTPTPTLREEMWTEVVDSALYHATDGTSSFADFMRSDRSFARTEDLASIYEVPPWDGESEPPRMSQPERAGFVTRAAVVATGTLQSRPIMKGTFLRKALLCDPIAAAPADAPTEVDFRPGMSTREVVAEMTESGSCATCHVSFINGLGFATENFDSFGRLRVEQPLFDFETGAPAGVASVETRAQPRVDGEDAPVTDAHELTDRILESDKPYACFSRQYYRFTFGRREQDAPDGCALEAVQDALRDGRPLGEVLRLVALQPQFRQRTFIED